MTLFTALRLISIEKKLGNNVTLISTDTFGDYHLEYPENARKVVKLFTRWAIVKTY